MIDKYNGGEFKVLLGLSLYRITKEGEIWSVQRGSWKRLSGGDRKGYRTVRLKTDGDMYKNFSIHRLVAMTHLSNDEDKPEVNHINGVKDDNRACNLEWVTRSENLKHRYRVLGIKGVWE